MKIGVRLALAFGAITVLLIIIVFVGLNSLNELNDDIDDIANDKFPKVVWANGAIDQINLGARSIRNALLFEDFDEREREIARTYQTTADVLPLLDSLRATITSGEGKVFLDQLTANRDGYVEYRELVVQYARERKIDEAVQLLTYEFRKYQGGYLDALNGLIDYQTRLTDEGAQRAIDHYNSSFMMLLIIASIAILIAIILAIFITRGITRPLNKAVVAAESIAKGNLKVDLDTDAKDETGVLLNAMKSMAGNINNLVVELNRVAGSAVEGKLDNRGNDREFQGEYQNIVRGFNATLDAVIGPLNVTAEYVDRISKGDIPPKITDEYKGDFNEIKNNINVCIDAINRLVSDAALLSGAASDGKLDTRADASRHGGDFRAIVEGVNRTLDNVIGPLNVAAEYVDRISKGDIPPKINDEYKGDFNEIKNNLNLCIDSLNNMIYDINDCGNQVAKGVFRYRANANKYQGDYRAMIEGINRGFDGFLTMIDALPVPAMAIDTKYNILYMNDIGAKLGNKTGKELEGTKCYQHFKTSHCETKNCACNITMDSNTGTTRETDAHPGGLDLEIQYSAIPIRDANGHAIGAFEVVMDQTEIKKAMNKTDKIANYQAGEVKKLVNGLQFLSEGNLNFDIKTDEADEDTKIVKTMFDNIASAMMTSVEAIKELVRDASMLSQAAIEGKLDVRADVSKHNGDFRTIVAGVNKTLDNVIGPLNVAAEYVDRISKGDMPPIITENYNGDFNEIKNNLNMLIDAIGDITEVAKKLSVGNTNVKLVKRSAQDELIESLLKMIDNIKHDAENVIKISNGELDFEIMIMSEDDILAKSTLVLQKNLKMLIEDAVMLSKAAEEGALKTRADVNKHFGDFRKIVEGVNKTLDLVIEPINEAGEVLSVMATGNLTVRMHGEYHGDLAKLKNDINLLADTLSSLLNQVSEVVQNSASSAMEISSTAEGLAAATQEQSAQADEVASAVEEMSRTITENAMSANKTADMAQANGNIATEGGAVVSQTVNKMRDIAIVVKNSAENIEKLGESSKQIGEIISVIDDIADQTNLLALNAAIEAARAGEQGRGFAVVADEVRKLAERTTEATKQIANMIKGIQNETAQAVVAMNKGNEEVNSGIELADKAGNSLQQILTSTREVMDMINQIAAASEEQSATSEQISKNVMSISKVTSESAHRVEDVAHTSDELAKMTEKLSELMKQFKVDDSDSFAAPTKQFERKGGKHLPAKEA